MECGPLGWSFTLAPLGPTALVGNLTLHGVTRAALTSVLVDDVAGTADLALARCAAGFGLELPFEPTDPSYWVDYDPEAREPLYYPDPVPAQVRIGVAGHAGSSAGAWSPPSAAAQRGEDEAAVVATPPVADEAAAEAALERVSPTSAGHEVIERLIDRLKELGLGREAAQLVVKYQGYGRTPQESRELYGRLRALLRNEAGAP